MNDEQREFAQQLGQKIVDLISDECDRARTQDLTVVFNMLVSVVAHYIGGVTDPTIRAHTYTDFGTWLRLHLDAIERDHAPTAAVITEGVDIEQ
jgi:hypothetical protein